MGRLREELLQYTASDYYPFHMPGHKRNESEKPFDEIMKMDITEIEGFDNLHYAEGIIKKEQDFAADLYGAKETFFLVNGSTAGVLAAICGSTEDESSVVLSRNSHKSAYHALYIKALKGYYVYPEIREETYGISGKIFPEDIADAMDISGAKVVFITSPTYEGIVSDIAAIADEVHKRNGILIVDEAHGAHFGFHPFFPKSAINCGADIVIQSVHKTLPCLTQTALLHICSDRIPRENIAKWLQIFQTSSPSYVLMASISRCIHLMDAEGSGLFKQYAERLKSFYEKTQDLKHLKVFCPEDARRYFDAVADPSKINICVKEHTENENVPYKGKELAKELLEEFHLQMEMVSENYVIAMTSIYDTKEGFERLAQALLEIDERLFEKKRPQKLSKNICRKKDKLSAEMSIKSALDGKKECVKWTDCIGRISAEYIYLYPPGSPILVPGERITDEIWKKAEHYKNLGLCIQGPKNHALETLLVAEETELLM